MVEKNSAQTVKKRGGKRPNAGRPRSKVRRSRRTIWASDDEMRQIKEVLLRNRVNDTE